MLDSVIRNTQTRKTLYGLTDVPHTDEVYGGTAAQLVQQQHYSGSFVCSFNVFYYPFDMQQCSILVQLSSLSKQLVTLTNARSSVEYNNNRNLQIYFVTRFFVAEQSNSNATTGSAMIEVSMLAEPGSLLTSCIILKPESSWRL